MRGVGGIMRQIRKTRFVDICYVCLLQISIILLGKIKNNIKLKLKSAILQGGAWSHYLLPEAFPKTGSAERA